MDALSGESERRGLAVRSKRWRCCLATLRQSMIAVYMMNTSPVPNLGSTASPRSLLSSSLDPAPLIVERP